jgi:quinol monooxygenase YgiN
MSELQLIARHTIAVGKEDEVLPLLPKLAAAALTEPGCLAFEVYRRLGDERSYVLLERYVSREALAAHRATEHFKDLVLGEIVPRLENRVLESFDVPDER